MRVEIEGVSIKAKQVTIKGVNLDNFLFADDLNALPEEVTFKFNRDSSNPKDMNYLYAIVKNVVKSEVPMSFGDMIKELAGKTIFINDNFKA